MIMWHRLGRILQDSRKPFSNGIRMAFSAVLLSLFGASTIMAQVQVSYLYDLSGFTGPVRQSWPRVSVDDTNIEVSILYQNLVRIFNSQGMEVYHFGDDLGFANILDVTNDDKGNIVLLTYGGPPDYACRIVVCSFRGEPIGELNLKNAPQGFERFAPQRLTYRNGRFYLFNSMDLKLLIADRNGSIEKGYNLFDLLGLQEKQRGNVELAGFSVAEDGSILFTIPVLFSAYRLYPNGALVSFGKPGSAPGRFNITGGIVLDSRGNYLVVDRLKSTVMIFNGEYKYMSQFGFRGVKAGNLVAPSDIVIDGQDRLYVTQGGGRGIAVFRLHHG
jgi:hypothetical protein